jgi:hypothetical protein
LINAEVDFIAEVIAIITCIKPTEAGYALARIAVVAVFAIEGK